MPEHPTPGSSNTPAGHVPFSCRVWRAASTAASSFTIATLTIASFLVVVRLPPVLPFTTAAALIWDFLSQPLPARGTLPSLTSAVFALLHFARTSAAGGGVLAVFLGALASARIAPDTLARVRTLHARLRGRADDGRPWRPSDVCPRGWCAADVALAAAQVATGVGCARCGGGAAARSTACRATRCARLRARWWGRWCRGWCCGGGRTGGASLQERMCLSLAEVLVCSRRWDQEARIARFEEGARIIVSRGGVCSEHVSLYFTVNRLSLGRCTPSRVQMTAYVFIVLP